jgi:RHS repeat-associated protein
MKQIDFFSSTYLGQVAFENQIVYQDWNGAVLKTVTKNWDTAGQTPILLSECVTLPNGLTSGKFYGYGSLDVVTDVKEYDYGILSSTACAQGASAPTATPTRETKMTPATFPPTPLYPTASIFDRPASVQVYGNGTLAAETDYTYDSYGTGITPVTAYAHDDTNFPATYKNRGNATTITRDCLQSCANAVSTYTFDQTGQMLSVTDPCGNSSCSDVTGSNHTTSYSYADSYSSGTPPGNTNTFITKITRPTPSNGVSHISNYSYSYPGGQLTVAKDENSQPTSYSYADPLARLTLSTYPDGGQTSISYNDTAPSPTITTSKLITSSLSLTTITTFDGMGHQVGTQLTTDPQGYDYTVTTYDGSGNVYTALNPYRSTSDPTYGTTTTVYDSLNRPTLVTEPDGSNVTTSYSSNCTTVTDEAGKTRVSCTDGLGRLTAVTENPGGLNWVTNYTYDALDDLTTALQGGSRKRSFVYDSLKRLTSSGNPETGGTSNPVLYTYDANGNVVTKTDARAIKITYTWDVLNRMNQRTYSNGDHYVGYGYDSATCVAVPSCYNIGHMTSMTDAAGTESWAYDKMGRLWGDQRTTAGITNQTSYAYNLDGSLNTLNYPSGHSLVYSVLGTGLPFSLLDSTYNEYYVDGGEYAPWGAPSQTQLIGEVGFNETILYNTRLQPCWTFVSASSALTATSCTGSETSSGNLMDVQYNFNLGKDNGDLIGITNNRNTNRSQSYSYDAVNRIAGAATLSTCTANCWNLAFGVDEWANITAVSGTGNVTLSPNGNNQIGAALFTYDASGNELTDATSTYAWNAESEMKTGGGVTYVYDGRGNRVEKSGTKLYWYGPSGEVLDETDTTGSTANTAFSEYVYFDGRRVARRDYLNNRYYYFEDQVNSSRVIAEVPAGTGETNLCYDADFYPYGGELNFTNTCAQNYKFQGKERDTETDNDYFGARYYSSTYGRFLSPDWSSTVAPVPYANLTNPQTLNLYTFVSDNPDSFADLDGHECCLEWALAGGGILSDTEAGAAAGSAFGPEGALIGAGLGAAIGAVAGGAGGNPSYYHGEFQNADGTSNLLSKDTTSNKNASTPAPQNAEPGTASSPAGGPDGPYKRPSNATTQEQRDSVQGQPCSTCGATGQKNNADHKEPLVKEYYRTGKIDKGNMHDPNSVQPQCQQCSNQQGGWLSNFSKQMKKLFGWT